MTVNFRVKKGENRRLLPISHRLIKYWRAKKFLFVEILH